MPEQKLAHAIEMTIKNDHMHKQLIDSCVRDIGVQHTQHRILMHISRNGTLPSQKKLAEHLKITPAAVTLSLKKLERDGFIYRTLGQDNRFNELKLTEKGRSLAERTRDAFSSIDKHLFDGFTEEELDVYISFLEKIKGNMENLKEQKKEGNP